MQDAASFLVAAAATDLGRVRDALHALAERLGESDLASDSALAAALASWTDGLRKNLEMASGAGFGWLAPGPRD